MSINLAYLDAGIWIAYGLGKDDIFYASSKELIENRLGKNKLFGIVSILTVLESIDAIRRRITERTDIKFLDNAYTDVLRRELIRASTEPKIKELATFLVTMERDSKLVFADFKRVDMNNIINETYDFEKGYFGIIRSYSRCGKCKGDYRNYSYKGLGFIDAMHLNLAKEYRCNSFITTDQYYAHVAGDENYSTLTFEIFRP